jgi:hypothetical protein
MERAGSALPADGASLRPLPVRKPPARTPWLVRLLVPIVAAAGLSACASISEKIASTASEMPAIGLPAGAPERRTDPPAYPAVHDMPPPRTDVVLTSIEQQKLEDDLVAARNRQQSIAGTAPARQKKADSTRPHVIPAASGSLPTASSGTIY